MDIFKSAKARHTLKHKVVNLLNIGSKFKFLYLQMESGFKLIWREVHLKSTFQEG
jgi:hypothetical protein